MRSSTRSVAPGDVEHYPHDHEHQSLLRFITCGSVDDGKSTLIGRLLFESKLIFEDQLAALAADSKRVGTQGDDLDLALLVDGLAAEREQGITIDVAYRYFETDQRKFIVADTPGHEQYTRNMITGASTADLALLLVDARKGLLTQTHRHAYLCSLIGIRSMILVVNKMDLVDFSQAAFTRIEREVRAFVTQLGFRETLCVPVSALRGDNVTEPSQNTPWYQGPSVMHHLETVQVENPTSRGPFRMPVQSVSRPHPEFRGFSGTIVGGDVRPGDRVRVSPSGLSSTVGRIVTYGGDLPRAVLGQGVTLTLADAIDISRGDVLASAESPPGVADQFEAHVIWLGEHDMVPGRPYIMKIASRTAKVSIGRPKYRINVNTLEHAATTNLAMNEIGVCNISVDQSIPFDPYDDNRDMGGFIVIDPFNNGTVGAGLLHFALRRADNLRWQTIDVDRHRRIERQGHRPGVVWLTGLSGSGKSTIANIVERKLYSMGLHTYLLDGDNVRHGLSRDLGFTEADRVENVRRVAEVAALMVDAGLIVLVAFISPYRAERAFARALVAEGEFCEVFVDSTLDIAEKRDPKGLYRKARRGELPNFTGVDSPYEQPEHPDVHLETALVSAEDAAEKILAYLRGTGAIPDH